MISTRALKIIDKSNIYRVMLLSWPSIHRLIDVASCFFVVTLAFTLYFSILTSHPWDTVLLFLSLCSYLFPFSLFFLLLLEFSAYSSWFNCFYMSRHLKKKNASSHSGRLVMHLAADWLHRGQAWGDSVSWRLQQRHSKVSAEQEAMCWDGSPRPLTRIHFESSESREWRWLELHIPGQLTVNIFWNLLMGPIWVPL